MSNNAMKHHAFVEMAAIQAQHPKNLTVDSDSSIIVESNNHLLEARRDCSTLLALEACYQLVKNGYSASPLLLDSVFTVVACSPTFFPTFDGYFQATGRYISLLHKAGSVDVELKPQQQQSSSLKSAIEYVMSNIGPLTVSVALCMSLRTHEGGLDTVALCIESNKSSVDARAAYERYILFDGMQRVRQPHFLKARHLDQVVDHIGKYVWLPATTSGQVEINILMPYSAYNISRMVGKINPRPRDVPASTPSQQQQQEKVVHFQPFYEPHEAEGPVAQVQLFDDGKSVRAICPHCQHTVYMSVEHKQHPRLLCPKCNGLSVLPDS